MKEGIHPKYETVTVRCACGETFETRSTKGGDLRVVSAPNAIRSLLASRSSWTLAGVLTDLRSVSISTSEIDPVVSMLRLFLEGVFALPE